jgi:hypothetical protein
MKITDEKWNELVAETQAGIDRWNQHAAEKNRPDVFSCKVEQTDKHMFLCTSHQGGHSEMKAVARERATGELRRAKPVRKRGKLIGVSIFTPDPKGWQELADKPANKIVGKLKLLDFTMFISSSVIPSPDTPTTEQADDHPMD